MQVTDVKNHVTHAVLGGGEKIAASISDDPALYEVLSKTLYTDTIMAPVREIICNAWDAHIETSITDKPLTITLTPEKLVVRDYGPGIPKDRIGHIYLTYGKSSKRHDGKQTGGFGFGSKAPWAYKDHFQVTSYHDGAATIYRMTKSSGEENGKPSASVIVSVPTQETGLEVSLEINRMDYPVFLKAIAHVVKHGNMLAKVNESIAKRIPYDQRDSCWSLVPKDEVGYHTTKNTLYVRYGSVIYPIPDHDEIHAACETAQSFIGSPALVLPRPYNAQGYALVLHAPPNSIAIAPSRETLSMQEHTIKTLQTLLSTFNNIASKQRFIKMFPKVQERIKEIEDSGEFSKLLTLEKKFFIKSVTVSPTASVIQTLDELVEHTMERVYPSSWDFYVKDIKTRIDVLRRRTDLPRGYLDKIENIMSMDNARLVRKVKTKPGFKHVTFREDRLDLLYDAVVLPVKMKLFRDLHADEVLSHKNIQFGSYGHTLNRSSAPNSIFQFIQRTVILTNTFHVDPKSGLEKHPELKETLHSLTSLIFYKIKRNSKHIAYAEEFFKKRGFKVVNAIEFLNPTPIPNLSLSQPVKKKEKTPRPKGLPSLAGVYDPKDADPYRIDHAFETGRPRVEKPEAWLEVFRSRAFHRNFHIDRLDVGDSKLVVQLLGNRVALVVTPAQKNTLKLAHIPEFQEFLEAQLEAVLIHSQEFKDYWQYDVHRPWLTKSGRTIGYSDSFKGEVSNFFLIPEVRTAFGLPNALSDTGQLWRKLWATMGYSSIRNAVFQKIEDHIAKQPIHSFVLDLKEKLDNRLHTLRFLDIKTIQTSLKNPTFIKDGGLTHLAAMIKAAVLG